MTEKRKVRICMDPSGSAWWTGALAGVAALKVWGTVQAREDRTVDRIRLQCQG